MRLNSSNSEKKINTRYNKFICVLCECVLLHISHADNITVAYGDIKHTKKKTLHSCGCCVCVDDIF